MSASARLRFPAGLDPAGFLEHYWQRRPLLMPGALADWHCDLRPQQLAGLACEEHIEARVILETGGDRPWAVHHGPFDEQWFSRLPETHWTLLVQDVDKHVPGAERLLDAFRFIPDWRVDDVMVSLAPDQGSVGPHADDYDVFLAQVLGRRRWQIQDRSASQQDCIPDLELSILRRFEADQEWVLGPGDVLYLPPGVPHWGVAQGLCMTCSVGFRAPSPGEMITSWCEQAIARAPAGGRYTDPGLRPQAAPAEIQPGAVERAHTQIQEWLRLDPEARIRWFGRLVTETKAHLEVEPRARTLGPEAFAQRYRRTGVARRNPCSRMAFCRGPHNTDYLFVNGEAYPLACGHSDFLGALTAERTLPVASLAGWLDNEACLGLLARLYDDGHLEL
jgi:50S ribosomal protein L16 3-hydroxylase